MAARRCGRLVNKHTEEIQDWTAVPQNTIVKSDEYDLADSAAALLHIQAALDTTTAHTGTRFVVQISGSETGNEDWQDLTEFVALIGTAATHPIEDAPLAAGSTDIKLTAHALTVLGKLLFIEDGTLVNSEIVMEASQTTNEVVIIDETTHAHVATTAIFNVAMTQDVYIPTAASRTRIIVDNSYDSGGSTLDYKARITEVLEV